MQSRLVRDREVGMELKPTFAEASENAHNLMSGKEFKHI
jgi:hypothetical protein